jgi:hypothetical protein
MDIRRKGGGQIGGSSFLSALLYVLPSWHMSCISSFVVTVLQEKIAIVTTKELVSISCATTNYLTVQAGDVWFYRVHAIDSAGKCEYIHAST